MLFISDIDGTLLKTGEPIHKSVKESIVNYRNLGGEITVCTGRAPVSVRKVVEELRIDLPCILYGGALIYDFSVNEILYKCIIENAKSSIFPFLRELKDCCPDVSIQVYTDAGIYLLNETKFLREKGVKEELTSKISTLQQMEGNILKVVLSCENEKVLERIKSTFAIPGITVAYASRHFMELCNCNATKGKALEELCNILNISLSECACAGDAFTDMSMMKMCRRTYAPENAMQEIREAADVVVPEAGMGGLHVAVDLECAILEKNCNKV